MNESFSVVNDNSQGLKLKFKIGVILFILGLFVLMNSHFEYSTWGYLSFLKVLKLFLRRRSKTF